MSAPTSNERRRHPLRFLWRYLRGSSERRGVVSASVGCGLFIGCLPVYGLHLPLCLLVCVPLRLDAVLAYVAANISNPLIAPILLFAEVQVGSWLLQGEWLALRVEELERRGLTGLVAQAALGSLVVGLAVAALGALLAWPFGKRRVAPAGDDFEQALSRTIRRYRQAPTADRFYVPMKLLLDPVVGLLGSSSTQLGRVLDVGAGRGQLSLFLLELGLADRVVGFDWDGRKVATATSAAQANGERCAEFFQADFADPAPLPPSDTALLVDVLHYLPPASQSALLRRVTAALSPGGRLIIRDLGTPRGWRSRLTRGFELLATRLGYNRAGSLSFRGLDELRGELEELGFSNLVQRPCGGALLDNALLVAEHRAGSPARATQASP